MDDVMQEKVEQLVDYIMKKCLWQFHSRTWDRERQNEGILTRTRQLLCGEPVERETPADRCYWVDAVHMVEVFRERYPWINTMDKGELATLMDGLQTRINHLTITGSLNLELTDQHY